MRACVSVVETTPSAKASVLLTYFAIPWVESWVTKTKSSKKVFPSAFQFSA